MAAAVVLLAAGTVAALGAGLHRRVPAPRAAHRAAGPVVAAAPVTVPPVRYPSPEPALPAAGPGQTYEAESCGSPAFCVAVGAGPDPTHLSQALISTWRGAAWAVTASPSTPGSQANSLSAVSCSSPQFCVAVGRYERPGAGTEALTEVWDGRRWSVAAGPGGRAGQLFSVSCPYQGFCVAVGAGGSSGDGVLIESWHGTGWSIDRAPLPAGAAGGSLAAVSCPSPGFCAAAGSYTGAGGRTDPLIVQFGPAGWRDVPVGRPSGAGQVSLSAVSCGSAVACRAGGVAQTGGADTPVAYSWDGSGWSQAG